MIVGNIFGSDGIIVLVIALVVIFGGSQLPKIARNVGSAGREFRKAQTEAEAEEAAKAAAKPSESATAVPPAPAQVTPAPAQVAPPPIAVTPPAVAPAPGDNVTISKADLEALLDERARKGNAASD
jgi:sec-independent protein translocase protein TatA